MAEIFGAGVTHYPALIAPDEDLAFLIHRTLKNDERLLEKLKDPINWPEDMRLEFGEYENFREDIIAPFCVLAYEEHNSSLDRCQRRASQVG